MKLSISDCSGLIQPEHGLLSSNFTLHGSYVTVSCDPGYRLSGDRILGCSSGSWSGNVGACMVEGGISYICAQELIKYYFLEIV